MNDKKLLNKYKVTHADGTPTNDKNLYFVLKLNLPPITDVVTDPINEAHVNASRAALKEYSSHIAKTLPELSKDIDEKLEQFNKVAELQKKVILLQEHLSKEEAKCSF